MDTAGGIPGGLHQRVARPTRDSRSARRLPEATLTSVQHATCTPENEPEQTTLACMAGVPCASGIAIPSRAAFCALLMLPSMVWLVSLLTGLAAFQGLPQRKRDVDHWMLWFDLMFRTMAGPAMPFFVLLIRVTGAWVLNRQHQHPNTCAVPDPSSLPLAAETSTGSDVLGGSDAVREAGAGPRADLLKPLDTGAPVVAASSAAVSGIIMAGNVERKGGTWVQLGWWFVPTFVPQCALVYLVISTARLMIYIVHLAMQAGVAAQHTNTDKQTGSHAHAFMSDHIFLAAAVTASLQFELVASVSDLMKMEAVAASMLGQLCAAAAFVLSAALTVCIALDMHFTARHFHRPLESTMSLVFGALLFQVCILWLGMCNQGPQ